MKYLVMAAAVLFGALQAEAQNLGSDYKTSIGMKVFPAALSAKHFVLENRAVEGLLYMWDYGSRLTGLYQIYGDIRTVEGMKWYIGGGAHLGYMNDKWVKDNPGKAGGISLGVDGVLGIDYKIKGAPVNISFDWQPSFNFVGGNYFEAGWGGLGIRYAF